MIRQFLVLSALAMTLGVPAVASSDVEHPEWDAEYTRLIREHTTSPEFLTDLVDHLPASDSVPSPLRANGYIAGAPDRLTYSADVHRYMRMLESTTQRVKVFTIGQSEDGREMIVVAIADEEVIASLDRHREITAKLADPRRLTEAEARTLIEQGRPIYYATGAMHSPETGSPEMLMELAYRLAVEETPLIRSIRANVITLITPVLEVDGRDRMVDLVRWRAETKATVLPPLAYWGKYAVHDNNRDAAGLALALTRNVLGAYFNWHPQVIHDLHESIPYLYISTGTGPYNAWLDPLMIDEWHRMAYNEVQTLTAKGMPGVWTHGFYDGWAPSYMFWVGMGRNTIGRFYETFGNAIPSTETRIVRDRSQRSWFRPNPPLPSARWSLRNNVNYQQSGLLVALADMATRRTHFLEQYYRLGQRAIAKARTEGPAAYVFTAGQKRQGQLNDAMRLLTQHGIEVHVTDAAFKTKAGWPPQAAAAEKGAKKESGAKEPAKEQPKESDEEIAFPAGSFVVRMDQPYSRLADALLDTQYVRAEDRVYDDTGWTLGYMRNLEFKRIVNQDVLGVAMHLWDGRSGNAALRADGAALAIENTADTDLIKLRAMLPHVRFLITEESIAGQKPKPAGTIIIPIDATTWHDVETALASVSVRAESLAALPLVRMGELTMPRIALLHTWLDTQDEGWYRLALDTLNVPYSYISTQDVAAEPELRGKYDVIIFPPAGGEPQEIVNGMPPGPPLPWMKSTLTPNLGVDETEDMRPGLGLEGTMNLRRFVEAGGLLITVGDSARWAADFGLARWVKLSEPASSKVRGSILKASVVDKASPIAFGYDESFPVYFPGNLVMTVGAGRQDERKEQRPTGRGTKSDPDVPQGRAFVETPEKPKPAAQEKGFQKPEDLPAVWEAYFPRIEDRPRVIMALADEADQLLLSGMLEGGEELAGKPVVVDAPLGKGHVVLFACNPMWRMTSQGLYALMMNAVFNHNRLGLGWPPPPAP